MIVLALILNAGLLFATGQSESTAGGGTASQPITLSFSWWGSDSRHKGTIAAIDLWNKEHPNIQVQYSYSGYDGYSDKLGTEFAGHNAPDVFQFGYTNVQDYASKGVMADLTPYKSTYLKDIDHSLWGNTTVDGKIYGVPAGVSSIGLAYNKTMLEKLGVPLPKDGITWSQLLDLAKQATANARAQGIKNFWGMVNAYDIDQQELEILFRQVGGSMWNADLTSSNFDTQAGQKVYAILSSFINAGVCVGPTDFTLPEGLNYLNSGAVAFQWQPLSAYPGTIAGANGKYQFGIIRLPGVVPGKSDAVLGPSMDIGIYSGSKHQKEAAEFLGWFLTNPAAAKVKGGMIRGLYPSAALRKAMGPTLGSAFEQESVVAAAIDKENNLKPYPEPANGDAWSNLYDTIKEKLVYGKIGVNEFLKEMHQNADPVLTQ